MIKTQRHYADAAAPGRMPEADPTWDFSDDDEDFRDIHERQFLGNFFRRSRQHLRQPDHEMAYRGIPVQANPDLLKASLLPEVPIYTSIQKPRERAVVPRSFIDLDFMKPTEEEMLRAEKEKRTVVLQRDTRSLINLGKNMMYCGMVEMGLANGRGEICVMNGEKVMEKVYEGEFKDGKYHGFGKSYCNNVLAVDGYFENGKLVSGKKVLPNGVKLVGTFVNNQLEGNGKMVLPNNITIEGMWKEGKPCGEMIYHIFDLEAFGYDLSNPREDIMISWNDQAIVFKCGKFAYPFVLYFNGCVFVGEFEGGNGAAVEMKNGDFFVYRHQYLIRSHTGSVDVNAGIKGIYMDNKSKQFKIQA